MFTFKILIYERTTYIFFGRILCKIMNGIKRKFPFMLRNKKLLIATNRARIMYFARVPPCKSRFGVSKLPGAFETKQLGVLAVFFSVPWKHKCSHTLVFCIPRCIMMRIRVSHITFTIHFLPSWTSVSKSM